MGVINTELLDFMTVQLIIDRTGRFFVYFCEYFLSHCFVMPQLLLLTYLSYGRLTLGWLQRKSQ